MSIWDAVIGEEFPCRRDTGNKRQISGSRYERWNDYRSFAAEDIPALFIVFEKRKQYNLLCNGTQEIFL